MVIITREKVKELLGITVTDYDTQIDRYIPIIDAKVKLITKNRYNHQIEGKITSGSTIVEVFGIRNVTGGIQNKHNLDDLVEFLEYGSIVSGTGIPSDTYIETVYYNNDSVEISGTDYGVPVIILSNPATSSDDNAQLFIGFNIGLQTTVAKGVFWLIGQESTNDPSQLIQMKRIGSVQINYGDHESRIDGKYGMPVWFVKAFPSYMSGY